MKWIIDMVLGSLIINVVFILNVVLYWFLLVVEVYI